MSGLFDKFYGAAEEVFTAAKKPIVAKRIKRKLQSAHDSAEEMILDIEAKIEEARLKFDDYDPNVIIVLQANMRAQHEAQEAVKEEYKELFDEELPR